MRDSEPFLPVLTVNEADGLSSSYIWRTWNLLHLRTDSDD